MQIHPLKQMKKQTLNNCSRHNPYRCYYAVCCRLLTLENLVES
jgi:hypothetical protein